MTRTVSSPSGRAVGIEPTEDELHIEPVYTAGRGSDEAAENYVPLPAYAVPVDEDEDDEDRVITAKASGGLTGLFIVLAILIPPVGLVASIVEGVSPVYRRSAIPTLIATIIGIGLWSWGIMFSMRQDMLDEPYVALDRYIEAQDWARDVEGHYLPLLELRNHGYLPGEFPPEGDMEYEFIEHVLGPTGYMVEVAPGNEEARIMGMESLWTDQTGDIRTGTRDGPRYVPSD